MTNLTDVYPNLANPAIANRFDFNAMQQAWDTPNTYVRKANYSGGFIRINNVLWEIKDHGKAYGIFTAEEWHNDESKAQRFSSIEEIEQFARENTISETDEQMTISETKSALYNTEYTVRDISGSTSYGYTYAIFRKFYNETLMCWDYSEPLAISSSVFDATATNRLGNSGAFRSVFDANAVNKIRESNNAQ